MINKIMLTLVGYEQFYDLTSTRKRAILPRVGS
jgi:hypothetical protein